MAESTDQPGENAAPPPAPSPGGAGLVLVVGPPRCGTTVVYDALRCHPYARLERSSAMFSRLIRGSHNRYPRDLCVQSGGIRFEQRKGEVVRAPSFGWTEDDNTGGWMVEKIHPHFFLFEPEWLIARVEQLDDAGARVRLVLRVREPRAMLRSQWLYKQRVPSWQSWLGEDSMLSFARDSYEAMLRLTELRDGALLSVHDEGDGCSPDEVQSLYDGIWPGEDWGDHAAEVAGRIRVERRGARAAGRFTASTDERDTAEFDALLKEGSTHLRACVRAYNKIVKKG